MDTKLITWGPEGTEKNRAIKVTRPCECGCGSRGDFDEGVGNLSGSDSEGNGFTLFIYDEATYQKMGKLFGERIR